MCPSGGGIKTHSKEIQGEKVQLTVRKNHVHTRASGSVTVASGSKGVLSLEVSRQRGEVMKRLRNERLFEESEEGESPHALSHFSPKRRKC
jgi:hypothetical protein